MSAMVAMGAGGAAIIVGGSVMSFLSMIIVIAIVVNVTAPAAPPPSTSMNALNFVDISLQLQQQLARCKVTGVYSTY